jgi:hypothetical protein
METSGDRVDPLARYADTVVVVARYSEESRTADPDYSVATVTWLAAGGDVPVEEVREEVLRWLVIEREIGTDNEFATRRRHFQMGASGAEAEIVLSLLGGLVGGVAGTLTEQAVSREPGL